MADSVYLGIDIGAGTTKLGLVRPDGSLLSTVSFATQTATAHEFLERLRTQLLSFARANPSAIWQPSGIGVSIAGLLDREHEGISLNPNLAFLENVRLRSWLATEFACKVVLDADSNAGALGEWTFGPFHNSSRFLCLSIGSGIGCGMLIEGELVRLYRGCLGDSGHVLVHPGGAKCGNGCSGCAEAEIAAAGLSCRAGMPVRDLIAAVYRGDSSARAVLAETGHLLGLALTSLSTVFWPDTIAIAGGISEAGDFLLNPARDTFLRTSGQDASAGVTIHKATLGWSAPLAGSIVPLL